jgi:hypothetical protein
MGMEGLDRYLERAAVARDLNSQKNGLNFYKNLEKRPTTYRQNITPIDGLRLPNKGKLTILSKLLGKWAVK